MKPAAISNLNQLKAHLSEGTRPLGALVYWTGLREVSIPRSTFRTEMERLGLGRAVRKDPSPEKCLNVAVKTATRSEGRYAGRAKVQLKAKGTHAVYAVLMRRDLSPGADMPEGRVRFIEEARIILERDQPNPAPQVVVATDAAPDDARTDLIDDICDEYQEVMSYVRTEEASKALTDAMELLGALSLRTGVYFVPEPKMPAAMALRQLFEGYTSIRITTWDLAATDVNVASSRSDSRAAFLQKVADLVRECKEFSEAKGDDITTKSVNARVRRFHELDGQAALYADILGDYATEIRDAIEKARVDFTAAVLGEQN